MNKIGEIIYRKRTEPGMTQAQLAGTLKVSFQSVRKWEHNRVEADFRKAELMDFRFDGDYDIIFSGGVLHFIRPAWREEVFDCMSGGRPHRHCMDTLIAQRLEEGTVL